MAFLKNTQSGGILWQNEGAHDRAAWQEIAALVFLKGARTSADEVAGLAPGEVKFLGGCGEFPWGLLPAAALAGPWRRISTPQKKTSGWQPFSDRHRKFVKLLVTAC
ncbi:MAG: hypothetical protein ACLQU2_11195 [Candidatus Binataceae bacterium]